MTHQVTLSDCLNHGIKLAAFSAAWGGFVGRGIPQITSNAIVNFVGITAGNYMVHNTDICKKFDETTKQIVVLALGVLVSSAVFGGFSLMDRTVSFSKFVKGQLGSSLIAFWIGWGVVVPHKQEV